jgi:hypothetical protein
MDQELRPHKKRLKRLQDKLAKVAETFDVELPERPAPEVEPDEETWLFDSDRNYEEQLAFYKARRKRGGDEGE